MQYQALINSIQRGVVQPVYLIHGEEEYLQEQVIWAFKNYFLQHDFGDFNFEQLDGEKVSLAQIVDAANTLPAFAEKRFVLIKNPTFLQAKKKDSEKEEQQQNEDLLLQYLQDPLTSTCLVFWLKGLADRRKKLVKTIEKTGQVLEIEALKGPDLNHWIKAEVETMGKRIEPKALEYLILHTHHQLRHLKNELEKISLFLGEEKEISLSIVRELLTKTGEANIFILVDALGTKRGEEALKELKHLLEMGEAPVRILYMIARQYRLILAVKDLEKRSYTEKQITSALAIHPFITGKILRQAKNFSFSDLEQALFLILNADVAIKTGSTGHSTLEDLVLKLVK